ncbi:MAG: ATP-binding protein, partial [bacterium]
DGLIDNKITDLGIDMQGNLWMLTPMGVSRMSLKTNKIVTFDKNDGLKTNYSGMYINDSILYIGAKNSGFYKFNINDIKINQFIPPVYITKIKVNNKILQNNSLENSKETPLQLKHFQSSVEFEFTALNYLFPEKNYFKFKLNNVDEKWNITTGKKRIAVYNNLHPGEYTFQVKASNNNGIWNNKPASIHFEVLPPWWKSWWAYLFYFIILTSLIYILYRIIRLQRKHSVDEMKLNFFTNVSHEYRTPLTLIIDPLEKLINSSHLPEPVNNQLKLIFGSAKRMKHLTNQILDLRKLESGNVKPQYQYADIILFIKKISTSFNFIAQKNNISFTINTPYESFYCYFDSEKLETILFNLLSNAFKFTFNDGSVSIDLDIINTSAYKDKNKRGINDQLSIIITNTGDQIPDNEIRKIFNKYYQTEQYAHKKFKGTGIGLALVKQLVGVLNGTIEVKNIPENKTSFIIKLPLLNKSFDLLPEISYDDNKNLQKKGHAPDYNQFKDGHEKQKKLRTVRFFQKPIMLIAEDNPEMRSFITSLFANDFRIRKT